MPFTRSPILYLLFLIITLPACTSPDIKQVVAKEVCSCLGPKTIGGDFISSYRECLRAAIERNKGLIAKQMGKDSLSNGDVIDFSIRIGSQIQSNCELLRKMNAIVDSTRESELASSDSVRVSMQKAMNSNARIEGRFKSIKKIAGNYYDLYLTVNDSVVVFKTSMLIRKNWINLLMKKGNNIILTYQPINNPETNTVDNIVTYMEPVYENIAF